MKKLALFFGFILFAQVAQSDSALLRYEDRFLSPEEFEVKLEYRAGSSDQFVKVTHPVACNMSVKEIKLEDGKLLKSRPPIQEILVSVEIRIDRTIRCMSRPGLIDETYAPLAAYGTPIRLVKHMPEADSTEGKWEVVHEEEVGHLVGKLVSNPEFSNTMDFVKSTYNGTIDLRKVELIQNGEGQKIVRMEVWTGYHTQGWMVQYSHAGYIQGQYAERMDAPALVMNLTYLPLQQRVGN